MEKNVHTCDHLQPRDRHLVHTIYGGTQKFKGLVVFFPITKLPNLIEVAIATLGTTGFQEQPTSSCNGNCAT